MLLQTVPKQAFGFLTEDIDGESVLFCPNSYKAIHLNETAGLIWKLVDGTRTVQDLIDFLMEEYPEAGSDVANDVEQAISELIREGALIATTKV